ncbi:hypothetical protein BZA70DRAFT_194637 [Myxozyma melibiosi]|uniref:Uncharacterized protein n=1 Tax=Myxozyma melibiosi TaxID=54550 RepID=A0ABR1F3T6_9ASCO
MSAAALPRLPVSTLPAADSPSDTISDKNAVSANAPETRESPDIDSKTATKNDQSTPDTPNTQAKRRPPSLIIDKSFTSSRSLAASNLSSNDSSNGSQKTSPSSSSNVSNSAANKTAKSAREIIQGLALHCVSPGLPPMNNEMVENIIKCKEIEKQQRLLIALRQKSVDNGSTLSRSRPGEGYDDNMLRVPGQTPGVGSEMNENQSPRFSKARRLNPEVQIDHERNAGKRGSVPSRIKVMAPAQYREAGYERAIQSAPLTHSMRPDPSEYMQRPEMKQPVHQRLARAQGSMLSPSALHFRKPPMRSRVVDDSMVYVPHERSSYAHAGVDAQYESRASSVPNGNQQIPKRNLARHHSMAESEPDIAEYDEHESYSHSRPSQGVKRSYDQATGHSDPRRSTDNSYRRRRFLELCSEMWDLFHEA